MSRDLKPGRTAEQHRFARALDHLLDRADDAPAAPQKPSAEARFCAVAKHRLEPLLEAFVHQAADHGRRATYTVDVRAGSATWRLQAEPPEMPDARFCPYIAFSCGAERDVSIIYGGVFPAPADHNGADAEIGWRDVDWDDVDKALLHFAERTFHRWGPRSGPRSGHVHREAEAS